MSVPTPVRERPRSGNYNDAVANDPAKKPEGKPTPAQPEKPPEKAMSMLEFLLASEPGAKSEPQPKGPTTLWPALKRPDALIVRFLSFLDFLRS